MAVYFFYGDEDFNIELELEKMTAKLNPDFKSMSLKILDNPDYSELITALRTPPMMFGEMLTIINAESYFLTNKSAFEESELADIEDALANTAETHDIVFTVRLPRNENKKLDSRRKLYKILSKYNTKEFPTFKTYKTSDIVNWIKTRAKTKDITVASETAEALIAQIGNNLREFDTELEKLKLIAYPNKNITEDMVKKICISNQDLFNFTELIMKGQKDLALLEFKKLLDIKHPLEILSAVQTMLRKWIILKTKSSMPASELAKLTGQHEFVVKQTLQKLKNTKASELVRLKQNLFDVEYKIKSAEAVDIIQEVECAIIR